MPARALVIAQTRLIDCTLEAKRELKNFRWQSVHLTDPKGGVANVDNDELLGKALYVASEAALLLLQKHGTVLPFGLTLDSQGDNPKTYFPRDQWPSAGWDELIDATISHLARCIASADVGVIVLATTLDSGSESGLGMQVETRSSSLFLVYPYIGTGQSRRLGEPQQADGLLVGPLLTVTKAQ